MWSLVLFLHLLAVCMWLGGMLFLGLVVVPSVRAHGGIDASRALVTTVGRKFGVLGGIAWVIILGTGLLMVEHRGGWGTISGTDYGRKITEKLTLLILIGVGVLIHSFVQAPGLNRAIAAGDEEGRGKWRRIGGILEGLMLLLTLGALYLGASLTM